MEIKECVIVIVKEGNMTTTRTIGDKELAVDYVKSQAINLLTH